MGTYHTLFVSAICTPLFTVRDLEVMEGIHREMHPGNLGRISAITLVRDMVGIPRIDDATRGRMVDLSRDLQPYVMASAVVLEGTGLQTSMARSLITFITMLTKRKTPHRAFGRLEDAFTWLAEIPGQEALLRDNAAILAQDTRALVAAPRPDKTAES